MYIYVVQYAVLLVPGFGFLLQGSESLGYGNSFIACDRGHQ